MFQYRFAKYNTKNPGQIKQNKSKAKRTRKQIKQMDTWMVRLSVSLYN